MTPLEPLFAAIDETLTGWEPDDNVAHFVESLRRNLESHMAPRMPTEAERQARRRARIEDLRRVQSADATTELDAMRKVFILLHPLGEDATMRVLNWVKQRIGDFPNAVHVAIDEEVEVPF